MLLLVLCTLLWASCKDPSKGLTLTVTPDVFDYTMSVKLYDAADPSYIPGDVTLTVSGTNAEDVYEISGKKKYNINNGFVSLGLLRKANPSIGSPARFIVEIRADGYLPLKIPVKIVDGQYNRQLTVYMIRLDNPPPGVSVKKIQIPLSDSAVVTAASLETPLSGDKKESAQLSIPAGTKFRNATGATLAGSSAEITLVHFDTRHPSSVNAFPGGARTSDNIVDTLAKKIRGYFQPAGTIVVMATVGGKTVTSFSQNLNVKTSVDGQQWNPATSANYLPGDRVSVFRRNTDIISWQQQKTSPFVMSGTKLSTTFSINLASIYTLAYCAPTCLEASLLWQSKVSGRDAYVVDMYAANDQFLPVASYVIQADSNEQISLADIPSEGIVLKVYPNTPEHPVTDFSKRTPAIGTFNGMPCNGGTSVMVDPGNKEPFYFDVQGYCSDDNTYIRPTFYVEYALKGSKDFQVLGLVENGRFATRNLDRETTYDFRITWGNRTSSLVTRKADGEFGGRVTVEVPPDEQETYCP